MEELPKEPNLEEVETDIKRLLEKLEGYYWERYDGLSPDLQDWWHLTCMEGELGKDRQAAKANLEKFIGVLEEETDKRK